MTTITGHNIDRFAMLAIAHGLELWAQHGIRVNRAYTPKAMMRAAERWTGQSFKARDYLGAAKALREEMEKP